MELTPDFSVTEQRRKGDLGLVPPGVLLKRCARKELALQSCRVNYADLPGSLDPGPEREAAWERLLDLGVRPKICSYEGSIRPCECLHYSAGDICPDCQCEFCVVEKFDECFHDRGPSNYRAYPTRGKLLYQTLVDKEPLWEGDLFYSGDPVRQTINKYGDRNYFSGPSPSIKGSEEEDEGVWREGASPRSRAPEAVQAEAAADEGYGYELFGDEHRISAAVDSVLARNAKDGGSTFRDIFGRRA